jgi:hypothetical protein
LVFQQDSFLANNFISIQLISIHWSHFFTSSFMIIINRMFINVFRAISSLIASRCLLLSNEGFIISSIFQHSINTKMNFWLAWVSVWWKTIYQAILISKLLALFR